MSFEMKDMIVPNAHLRNQIEEQLKQINNSTTSQVQKPSQMDISFALENTFLLDSQIK